MPVDPEPGRPGVSRQARDPEPIAVRVSQAVRLVGIGRSTLYQLMNSGEIETIKVGRITLIPTDSLREFIRKRRR